MGFRDGEGGAGLGVGVDAGVDAGADAGADALAEPLGLADPGGAEAVHSSTATFHVAFEDPMLR